MKQLIVLAFVLTLAGCGHAQLAEGPSMSAGGGGGPFPGGLHCHDDVRCNPYLSAAGGGSN